MNIIIVGAGTIGLQIAHQLSLEDHNVFLVDIDKNRLEGIQAKDNLLTVSGNITQPKLLEQVDILNCDVFITTTNSDEINMVSCLVAKKFNIKLKIARVRDYFNSFILKSITNNKQFNARMDNFISKDDFGIDVLINPEEVAAKNIINLIHSPEAFDIINFENGQLQIKGFKVSSDVDVVDMLIKDFSENDVLSKILVLALIRDNVMIIPSGVDKINAGDIIYVIGKNEDLHCIAPYFQKSYLSVKQAFIIGVSNISRYLLSHFSNYSIKVKLIESDEIKASRFAQEYESVEVINANPTDLNTLLEEGLESADVFIAVSDDEEKNLLSSMLAKKNNVSKTFAKLQNDDYIPFTSAMGIDSIVNPKLLAVGEILKYVRKGNVLSVDTLFDKNVEIASYEITSSFSFFSTYIKDIAMPSDSLIAAIIRDGDAIIPKGDDVIMEKDKVVIFYHSSLIEEISRLFGI